MALPVNPTPVYNLTIPSTNKKVKFRPWLVKEEKSLLIAQQSEDPVVMTDTLKTVIKSCILDKVNIESLATFDIEYLFTQIRSKSVGEEVDLVFKCKHCDDPKARTKIKFDISKINVVFPEGHSKKIQLFNDVGVVMKYPSIASIQQLNVGQLNDIELIFNIVANCIDYIYDDKEIHYVKDITKEELDNFLSQLTTEQFAKLEKFFNTLPKMRQEVDYTCPICGAENHVVLEGMTSFF